MKTIAETALQLRNREISSVELTQTALDRIEIEEPRIHAFLHVATEHALAAARRADARFASGEATSPLCGIPFALKDNISTMGIPTTCASRILEGYIPQYDATVAERLGDTGAVMIGKTNLDEFAMGSSTEFSAWGPTRNPHDPSRVPGGSSGGSGASVAADEVFFALGSDTGGSVRLPASFCGVVGMKPTYGRVSRYGLIAFGSSLDQIGPFTRTVEDCALVMNAICGQDARDSTSLPWPVPNFTEAIGRGVRGLRLGVPTEYFATGLEPGVESAVRTAIRQLEREGAIVDEVAMPHTKYALACYYVIAPAEASANLARYDGVKYGMSLREGGDVFDMFSRTRAAGFGAEVKRRIMLGTYALSSGYYDAYYLKAQKVRTLVKSDFDRAFEKFDALVTPVCPSVAFKFGERMNDPVSMYLSDILTVTVNCAGIPGVSVPCGLSEGMPVGLQVLGPTGGEETILRIADAVERNQRGGR